MKKMTLKDAFLLTGLTMKQKLITYWCALSFVLLLMAEQAPMWFYILDIISCVLSSICMKDIPTPDYFKGEHYKK